MGRAHRAVVVMVPLAPIAVGVLVGQRSRAVLDIGFLLVVLLDTPRLNLLVCDGGDATVEDA